MPNARLTLTEHVDEYTLTLTQTQGGLWWGEMFNGAGYSVWISGLLHSKQEVRSAAWTAYRVLPLVVA